MSDEAYEVVRAKSFELVDERGELRALLGSDPNGSVGLEIYGDEQTPRLTMGVNREGTARIDLREAAGTVRARLAVDASGTPAIFSIRDAEDRIRAQVAMHDGEAVGVNLMDETGGTRAQIMVHPDGYASVILEDTNGNVVSGFDNAPNEMDPMQPPAHPPDVRIDLNSDTFGLADKDEVAERLRAGTDLRVESEVAAYAGVEGGPAPPDLAIYILYTLVPVADIYANVLATVLVDAVKTAFSRQGKSASQATYSLLKVDEEGRILRDFRVETDDPELIRDLIRQMSEEEADEE